MDKLAEVEAVALLVGKVVQLVPMAGHMNRKMADVADMEGMVAMEEMAAEAAEAVEVLQFVF